MPNAMLELLRQSRDLYAQAESPLTHPRRKPALESEATELYNQALDMREMCIKEELERMAEAAGVNASAWFTCYSSHRYITFGDQSRTDSDAGAEVSIWLHAEWRSRPPDVTLPPMVWALSRFGAGGVPLRPTAVEQWPQPYDPAAIIEAVRKGYG